MFLEFKATNYHQQILENKTPLNIRWSAKFQQKYQRINGELFILSLGFFLKHSNSGVEWRKFFISMNDDNYLFRTICFMKSCKIVEKGLKPVFGEKFKNLKKLM